MDKVIFLIEDDLTPLDDMLLSVQSILFVSSLRKLNNAPQNGDTKIYVLHVIWDNKGKDEEQFPKYKRNLEARQQELKSKNPDLIPNIQYDYNVVSLDNSNYLIENDQSTNIIDKKITELSKNSERVILLDVILNKDKDQNALMNDNATILSQRIYNKYSSNCIPYTNYADGDMTFRKKWKNGVEPPKMAYERFCIDGNVIYKPFRDEIYKMLKIGD